MIIQTLVRQKQFQTALVIILLVAALFGILFCSFWPVENTSGDLKSTNYLAAIYGPNIVRQSFVAPVDDLARIDIWLRNPGRAGQVTVVVSTADDNLTYAGEIILQDTAGPVRYSFSFPPLKHKRGEIIEIALLAPDLSQERSPAVLFNTTNAATAEIFGLSLNEQRISGKMVMALYTRPTSLRALEQLSGIIMAPWKEKAHLTAQRISQYKPRLFKGRSLIALVSLNFALGVIALAYFLHHPAEKNGWNAAGLAKNLGFVLWGIILTILLVTGIKHNSWRLGIQAIRTGGIIPNMAQGPVITHDLTAMLNGPNATLETLPGNSDYIAPRWFDVPAGERAVLWMHPPSRASFVIKAPPQAQLAFGAGIDSKVWDKQDSDGVEFVITVATAETIEQIYWRAIDPAHNPDDRRWFEEEIDLSRYAGQEVQLMLNTYPRGNNSWDWAGWGHPIISGQP